MDIKLNNLNKTIINCKKCPRLVKFIKRISTKKRKQTAKICALLENHESIKDSLH